MTEKIIQVDTNKLKELFSEFNNYDNMRGLLNTHSSLEANLDQQKFYSLSEAIRDMDKRANEVNNTLLQIKNLLIKGGCVLD